jgi:transposase-like protein
MIALADGYRESEQSWKELLLDCKARGLDIQPSLAIGDGALGFWRAMRQVWDSTREQRCWVHKMANILDKLPTGSQAKAKGMLHEIHVAETKSEAEKAFDLFVKTYEAKYPKATECLAKDREALLTFYDFPGEHWVHIRTTNPIESVFATVRLRHDKTKGSGTRTAGLPRLFFLSLLRFSVDTDYCAYNLYLCKMTEMIKNSWNAANICHKNPDSLRISNSPFDPVCLF